jgi:hypothetical protein
MSEFNILMKMTIEKRLRIEKIIIDFLGHVPDGKERKDFTLMNHLDECQVLYKGKLVGTVINENIEEPFI